MTDRITVTTGARLHFGLLVAGPPERRVYGGAGVMIDRPRFSLTARRGDQTVIQAAPATQRRVADILNLLEPAASGLEIRVREEVPAHAGLGSGTQLALAVAAAWSRLHTDQLSVEELAQRLGRGTRSVVGAVGFESGGMIGQHLADLAGTVSTVPIRLQFPTDWRFVLVTPPGNFGLSGELERQAFREMPPMTDGQLHRLSRLQATLLASVTFHDFSSFSEMLQLYGQIVGEYFAPLQAGLFASRHMAELAEILQHNGYQGIGQSSWGPTLFAACESAADAGGLADRVNRWDREGNCQVQVVAAKNTGAEISMG